MTTTPSPGSPAEPEDPELRDRYRLDAAAEHERRRAEGAARAAEVVSSRTPSGPITVIALLVTVVLVVATGLALLGPMLKQSETSERELPAGMTSLRVHADVGDVRVRAAEPGEEPGVGDVTVEAAEPPRRVDARLGVGELTIRAPDDVGYRVETTGMDVNNQLGRDSDAPRRIIGEVGVGGLTIQPG